MNRITLLMTFIFFELFLTLVVGSISLSTSTDVTQGIGEFSLNLGGIWSMIVFWFRMMTFQVESIPSVITILVFYPINIGIAVIIAEMVRGN